MFYNNFVFNIFFFLLGAISILGQTVILREITTLFYGNELFYGLGLSIWLLFTGLGSLVVPIVLRILLPSRHGRVKMVSWLTLSFLSLFLPVFFILIRFLVAKTVPFGQLPSFWFSLICLGGLLSFLCFPLGALFPLGVIGWQSRKKDQPTNRAYFWETIGFAFGGLSFAFILATTTFPLVSKLNSTTLKWRYPGLIKTFNSKYNQIVVSQNNHQQNFFINGQFVFNNQESFENQQLLNLIKPFISNAVASKINSKNILVLGGPTLTLEIEKILSPSRLDFLEIDDPLLQLQKPLLDKKTKLIIADPRQFLNQTQENWDLIIFSPGNPQTLLSNRYFTSQCFWQVKNHLTENGVFVLLFYLPTDYQSQEAIRFGASIYQTLKTIFPAIELLTPEDQIVLIASENKVEFDESKIDPQWRQYFWYQIKSKRREEILKKLTDVKERLNTDLEPVAFFYQQLFWQTIFSFKLPTLMFQIAKFLPLFLLLIFLLLAGRGEKKLNLGLLVGLSSFVLMSLETLIILMFQTKIGYLYSQISLIFTSVLLGMAVGVKIKYQISNIKYLFLGYVFTCCVFLLSFQSKLGESSIFWFILAFASGVVGGAIFAIVNRLYPMNHYRVQGSALQNLAWEDASSVLRQAQDGELCRTISSRSASLQKEKNPGFIYAFDLFGGALGAFLTAGFLLPVFGVKVLVWGLAGLIFLIFTQF